MTRSFLLILSAAAVGGGGFGFLAGSRIPPAPGGKAPATPAGVTHKVAPPEAVPLTPLISSAVPAPRIFANSADAAATLRTLREKKNPRAQMRDMHALCASLDSPGVLALLTAVRQGAIDRSFDRSLVENLFERWTELDPRAAADYAVDMDRERRTSGIGTVLSIWARATWPRRKTGR